MDVRDFVQDRSESDIESWHLSDVIWTKPGCCGLTSSGCSCHATEWYIMPNLTSRMSPWRPNWRQILTSMDGKTCSQKDVNRRPILASFWPKPDVPECPTDVRLLARNTNRTFFLSCLSYLLADLTYACVDIGRWSSQSSNICLVRSYLVIYYHTSRNVNILSIKVHVYRTRQHIEHLW